MTTGPATCWICHARPYDGTGGAAAPQSCRDCARKVLQPFEYSWKVLHSHLTAQWANIVKLGRFDLSKAFPQDARIGALHVHLYFVAALGARLAADSVSLDLAPFVRALLERRPHADVSLFVADARVDPGSLRLYDADLHLLRNQDDAVHSALWYHLAHPVTVKVNYLKPGAPLCPPPGHPWHPVRQRKLVMLSPYRGEATRRDTLQSLRI